MIEVAAAIAGAQAAFNTIKSGVNLAKDVSSFAGPLTKWAGHMAELEQADKMASKPSWFKVLGGGTQAEAMEIFLAKKKAEQLRDELREIISHPAILGPSHWTEFIRIENEVKKRKRQEEFRIMEMKRKAVEITAGIALFLLLTGALVGFLWFLVNA